MDSIGGRKFVLAILVGVAGVLASHFGFLSAELVTLLSVVYGGYAVGNVASTNIWAKNGPTVSAGPALEFNPAADTYQIPHDGVWKITTSPKDETVKAEFVTNEVSEDAKEYVGPDEKVYSDQDFDALKKDLEDLRAGARGISQALANLATATENNGKALQFLVQVVQAPQAA